nr:hypothetical protein [Granulicella tundricola]
MGSGSREKDLAFLQLIDQKPVRLNVAFAMIFPAAAEEMIVISHGQFNLLGKEHDDLSQLGHLQAPALHELRITTKSGGHNDFEHC